MVKCLEIINPLFCSIYETIRRHSRHAESVTAQRCSISWSKDAINTPHQHPCLRNYKVIIIKEPYTFEQTAFFCKSSILPPRTLLPGANGARPVVYEQVAGILCSGYEYYGNAEPEVGCMKRELIVRRSPVI